MNGQGYVHQADVMLAAGTDPATVGAMVTVALCGHWEHDGPCRWPHHNQIEGHQFKTVFIATPEDEPEVTSPDSNCTTRPPWLARSFGRRPHFSNRRAEGGRATGASTTTALTETLTSLQMVFTKRLREGIRRGRIRCSVSHLDATACQGGWSLPDGRGVHRHRFDRAHRTC